MLSDMKCNTNVQIINWIYDRPKPFNMNKTNAKPNNITQDDEQYNVTLGRLNHEEKTWFLWKSLI